MCSKTAVAGSPVLLYYWFSSCCCPWPQYKTNTVANVIHDNTIFITYTQRVVLSKPYTAVCKPPGNAIVGVIRLLLFTHVARPMTIANKAGNPSLIQFHSTPFVIHTHTQTGTPVVPRKQCVGSCLVLFVLNPISSNTRRQEHSASHASNA